MAALARRHHFGGGSSLARRAQAIAMARIKNARHPIEEVGISALAGVALAFLESKMPLSVAGLPSKPLLVGAAVAVEMHSKGRMREAAKAIAMVGAGVYGYNAYKTKTLIAGDTVEGHVVS